MNIILDGNGLKNYKFKGPYAWLFSKLLKEDEFEKLEGILKRAYPCGISEESLEYLFENDMDSVVIWLGYKNYYHWVDSRNLS